MLQFYKLFFLIPLVLSSDVLEFKDSDFESKVSQYSIILVEFYAPWCGHCKKLAPEYEIAATKLKSNDPPISLAKVDCTAETKTCEKYGVSGYPTLKVFKNGEFAFEYGGERNADGIIKYMNSKSGPSCKHLTSDEEFTKFLSSDDPVVIGFFSNEDTKLEKTLKAVADKLSEDFRFAYVTSSSIGSSYKLENDIAILYPKRLHNKFEDKYVKYTGDDSQYKLQNWIENNVMGLAGHRTPSNSKYFERKPLIVAYYDVDYEKNPKGTNYWRNRILKVGKKFIDAGKNVHFAVSSVKELNYELGEFGIESPDNNKVYILARDESNNKFKMNDEFSMSNLEKFLTEFFDGKLTAYLKSEPIPEKNDEPVKVVVAKNFDQIVNDPSKDVLIEFYAPWCGHCKSLAPKYEELAKRMSKEKDIVIAKMDATANDVPKPFDVTGFPTLYFVPKNSKSSPRQYNQGREVDDFVKYIAAEATSPLDGFDRNGAVKKVDL